MLDPPTAPEDRAEDMSNPPARGQAGAAQPEKPETTPRSGNGGDKPDTKEEWDAFVLQ